MTDLGRFLNNMTDEPEQFFVHGPMYQAECNWCGTLLDVYDSATEATDSTRHHDCRIQVTKSELDSLS